MIQTDDTDISHIPPRKLHSILGASFRAEQERSVQVGKHTMRILLDQLKQWQIKRVFINPPDYSLPYSTTPPTIGKDDAQATYGNPGFTRPYVLSKDIRDSFLHFQKEQVLPGGVRMDVHAIHRNRRHNSLELEGIAVTLHQSVSIGKLASVLKNLGVYRNYKPGERDLKGLL